MPSYRGHVSPAEERARHNFVVDSCLAVGRCRVLLDELEVAIMHTNLPAIGRTQEALAEAVEALADARHGPAKIEPEEKDYDREDGL